MLPHLYLPPELWSKTLKTLEHRRSQEELIYLWTSVRNVSSHFKDEIEGIFVTEHMAKVALHANCGRLQPYWRMRLLKDQWDNMTTQCS